MNCTELVCALAFLFGLLSFKLGRLFVINFRKEHGVRRSIDLNLDKGFWGGVAMSAPFYAEFFSWRWAGLLAAPFFLLVLIFRKNIKPPHVAVLPMVALLLLHLAALGMTDTVFASQVVKDLIIASFLLFIYVLAGDDTAGGFFYSLVPLALITALLGLVKAGLLDRGYLLGFLIESCTYYPPGSALCVNYNNLGFMWLVGALGCLRKRLWWLLPVLIAAGALSSSRRFVVLMVFIPVVWVLLEGRSVLFKSLLVGFISAFLIYAVSDPASFQRYRFGVEPYRVLEFNLDSNFAIVQVLESSDSVPKINRSTPMAMLSTMADGTLGTESRLEYWKLGTSMMGWFPQGWSYHKVFSCSFSPCSEYNYPHNSIVTEWIIGGVVFGLVAIAFYAWPFLLIWRTKSVVEISIFLFSVPYSLMSGDTVFSLPACIACMLVALSAARKKE